MEEIVYLARHATPDWTRRDLSYHLPPGPPLTPQGVAEAEALGGFLQGAGAAKVFTSPLERCLHTARIAAGLIPAPVEVLPHLVEWQPGEAPSDVVRRLWPAIEQALQTGRQNGPSALITHGGPIAVLLEECGMSSETLAGHRIYDHNNPLPPAGVWRMTRDREQETWNLCLVFKPGDDHHSSNQGSSYEHRS